MIDQRFMDDLAKDFVLPIEKPEEDTMLAAGPVTSDVPQTGVRLGRAGVTPQQSAKAGGLDKPLIALLDTLAGAMRGATGAAIGLPGDIRSIVDMINQEGAEAVMGKRMFPTSEEVLQSNTLPQVVPASAPNAAERQKTVDIAQGVGEFLPAPGLLDVPKVVKGATKAVQATKNMPVGMSTQIMGEGVSELGFYSAAKEAVNSIQQPKGTGEQFLKQIEKTPGVKPEEIKWTGLDDFLKSKKSVTKAEVQEFLDKNRVEVKEVSLADGGLKKKFSVNSPEDQDFYDVIDKQGKVVFTGPEDDADYLIDRSLTKFSKYTLPGGENYREILLTLPEKPSPFKTFVKSMGEKYGRDTPRNQWSPEDNSTYDSLLKGFSNEEEPFRSGHFDQPNILAHLRVNDRVDADGKKVLFVEEVQSDWHQAGRKKGYQNPKIEKEIADIQSQMNAMAEVRDPVTNQMVNEKEWFALGRKKDELAKQIGFAPDAPFKTTWHELAMKRAIQLAAEGGYDRVAFTTGKTQAERYDLSKQIDELLVTKNPNGTFNLEATMPNGGGTRTVGEDITADKLDDIVGKDLANSIRKQESKGDVYSADDLRVGGEGMKGFYDQILPKFLDKYAKKWDGKVGKTNIQADGDSVAVQYIDVTPKMKESVLTKGQPLFAIGAGGAAVQQEDNQ